MTVGTVEHGDPIADADGNTYNTVWIGDQLWTTENLRTTQYNDSTPIPFLSDSAAWCTTGDGAYCYYGDTADTAFQRRFGALYNWHAVSSGKLAPDGWRVPSDSDWTELQTYLIANGYNHDALSSGNKIAKSLASQTDWRASTNHGTIGCDPEENDITGFTALPGGLRTTSGEYRYLNENGLWWSTTDTGSTAYYRDLNYNNSALRTNALGKTSGFSVRLVKDLD